MDERQELNAPPAPLTSAELAESVRTTRAAIDTTLRSLTERLDRRNLTADARARIAGLAERGRQRLLAAPPYSVVPFLAAAAALGFVLGRAAGGHGGRRRRRR